MSGLAEKLSHTLLAEDYRSQGLVIDLNTGVVRRDHILIQRTPGADLFFGFGPSAGRLLDFAFDGAAENDPFLRACASADQIPRASDLTKTGGPHPNDALAAIADRHLRRLALAEMLTEKADVDDPKHPGYPAGAPDSEGGQFRPKDGAGEGSKLPVEIAAKEAAEAEARRIVTRRSIRTAIRGILQIIRMGIAEYLPLGDLIEIAMIPDLIDTVDEFERTYDEAKAAADFAKNGPYSLGDLQSGEDSESFSSFDAFKKISTLLDLLSKRFGPAGPGQDYHHIVTQGGLNDANIPAEQLQSTDNIIKLPRLVHELVSKEYRLPAPENTSMTLYDWLQTQPYDVQRAEGIKVLQRLGIVKSPPLNY